MAVGYHFFLSVWNSNVQSVTISYVYICEFAIIFTCLIRFFIAPPDKNTLSILLIFILLIPFLSLLVISSYTGFLNIKLIRDICFVFLFFTAAKGISLSAVVKILSWLLVLILSVAIFEMLFPGVYGQFVNPVRYFLAIGKDMTVTNYNESTGLFISSYRGEGRYFPFFGVHRISSIFIEPITFAFFTYFTSTFLLVLKYSDFKDKPVWLLNVALLISVFLLWLSDSRQAVLLFIFFALFFYGKKATKLNISGSNYFFIYASLIMLIMVGYFLSVLPYRLDHSLSVLFSSSFLFFLGIDEFQKVYVDSGFLYIISNYGLLSLLGYLSYLLILGVKNDQGFLVYHFGVCIFVFLSLFLTYGYLSTKVSVFMWFSLGCLYFSDGKNGHVQE